MKFGQAYVEMLKGKRITRPYFEGWWYINGVTGKFTIHLQNGDEITEGNLGHMISNVIAEDWMVVEEHSELKKQKKKEEKTRRMLTEEEKAKIRKMIDNDVNAPEFAEIQGLLAEAGKIDYIALTKKMNFVVSMGQNMSTTIYLMERLFPDEKVLISDCIRAEGKIDDNLRNIWDTFTAKYKEN